MTEQDRQHPKTPDLPPTHEAPDLPAAERLKQEKDRREAEDYSHEDDGGAEPTD
ncbi:hypothetical protein [Streptomyces chumphonensis]|uniref:hypothetical protein n=1 Tax=Streptomyces chumphonensis TaxID=1214925 RepID=UPI003D747284